MATLPEGLTQEDIDRLALLSAGVRRLVDEYEELKDKVKRSHKEAGITGKKTLVYPSEKHGAVIVKLGEQKRVDTEALEQAHPYDKFPQYWRTQFDQKAVDATVLNRYRTNIIPTISVEVSED